MTDDELPLDKELKISRANGAGVPAKKIADYLNVSLAQVEAVIAIDERFRVNEAEFAAWIAANAEKRQ